MIVLTSVSIYNRTTFLVLNLSISGHSCVVLPFATKEQKKAGSRCN